MSRNFRARIDRLEKSSPDPRGSDLSSLLITRAMIAPDKLTPDDREQLRLMWEKAEADVARASEGSVAGRIYREELDRLGLPQPVTLAGIDVVEECIRLTGISDPQECEMTDVQGTSQQGSGR